MKTNLLGRTGLKVSEICLGTMTWGTQNSDTEAHEQLDYALGQGVNFIDTAEAYPTTPSSVEVVGRTEEIIGSWLHKRGRRDEIVLASKVAGKGNRNIRDGAPISAGAIRTAIEQSLRRLRTDYLDLYQLHWPNRGSYHFRQSWNYDPSGQDAAAVKAEIEEILDALDRLVKAGKVRHIGLSNETAWGTGQYLAIAEARNLPRVASIQNEYSLMHRIFDLDLAELSLNEDVGLLAYSPLAAGMLTGKYSGGAIPAGSRGSINKGLGGRLSASSLEVADSYGEAARRHGLEPAQMALAFCLSRPFITSVIIGATSMDQLRTNIAAADLELSDDVRAEIASIHRRHPIPL
jgi:aryl-alcohol dehydrogenase-like predicted oxidoreductase